MLIFSRIITRLNQMINFAKLQIETGNQIGLPLSVISVLRDAYRVDLILTLLESSIQAYYRVVTRHLRGLLCLLK